MTAQFFLADWFATLDEGSDDLAPLFVGQTGDDDLLAVLDGAGRIRRHHHGRQVRVHVLQNAKSGVCTEDCTFCSQSLAYNAETDVPKYAMQQVDELVAGAEREADCRRALNVPDAGSQSPTKSLN